jgi:hypothetical protein
MKRIALITIVVLALAGCAADTSAAYKNCGETMFRLWEIQNADASQDEWDAQLEATAEQCRAAAEADPAGFNEEWKP